MATFAFRFHPLYRLLGAPFGIAPGTCAVSVTDDRLEIRFGPWLLRTAVSNVVSMEHTGGFSIPKTAGPAHLSLVDHGVTFATNPDAGLCLRFGEPVPAIDPFGRIRHPGATVTVDRIDDLERVLRGRPLPDRLDADDDVQVESPWQRLGRWARWPPGMALAVARYAKARANVKCSFETRDERAPTLGEPADGADVQTAASGVGSILERTYSVRISRTSSSPEELLERVAADVNRFSPVEVAEFHSSAHGDRVTSGANMLVRMPGPWNAPVRVVERTPTAVRLATLDGHPEAGQITFRSSYDESAGSDGNRSLRFEIRSIARTAGRPFSFLYDRLHLASEMQLYLWAHFCRRAADVAGGDVEGKIEVHTVRYTS